MSTVRCLRWDPVRSAIDVAAPCCLWTAAGHAGAAVQIDATLLYASLEGEIGALNLEGGWISGSRFFLLQRGNRRSSQNALIVLELEPLARRPASRGRAAVAGAAVDPGI